MENYLTLDEDEKVQFANFSNVKKYRSGEIILESNKTCKSLLFIVSGSARSFFLNEEGKEYTWNFYFNDADSNFGNFFIFDYNSFIQQTPTPMNFQAITDVEAIELRYEKVQYLLHKYHKIQAVVRLLNEQAFSTMYKRAFSLLTQPAKERYLDLLKEKAYLLNKFQHYLIASYLGIAPQSLSRLRKEIFMP